MAACDRILRLCGCAMSEVQEGTELSRRHCVRLVDASRGERAGWPLRSIRGVYVPRPLIATIIFVATTGCTVFFVWQVRRVAVRLGLFGRMGERHLHTRALPRVGGVGIFLGF